MRITFIGLGIMGSRMAAHLQQEDIELTVYNRDMSKSAPFTARGINVANSIEGAVKDAQVVFTMLADPTAVEAIMPEVLEAASEGTLWVDCSTVGPGDARKFHEAARKAGVNYLEAPVAGTKQPAERGELVFFVGGDQKQFELIERPLSLMGQKSIYMGPAGNAASIKLLVNLLLGQSLLAYSEAVKLGERMGLSLGVLQDILLNSPVTAPFLQVIRKKIDAEDKSTNFPLELMHKDLRLVQHSCAELGIALPSAALAKSIYAQAEDSEKGRMDFSAIFQHILNS